MKFATIKKRHYANFAVLAESIYKKKRGQDGAWVLIDRKMFYGEPRIAMGAHEVGHLLGQPDEYPGGAVDTAVNGDGTVDGIDGTTLMGSFLNDESKNQIKKRHYSNFSPMAELLMEKLGRNPDEWEVVEKGS
jgi:hypothetical protein